MECKSIEEIKVYNLWPKKRVLQSCAFLFAERFFGAISLYYLARIGAESQNLDRAYDSIIWLFIFYFLKVLMLIPSRYFEVTTSAESYFKALELCAYGQAEARKWANRAYKDTFQSAIGYQLFDAIRNLTNSYKEILNFLLNYMLSFAIFGVFLKGQVVFAFCLSLLLSMGIFWLSRGRTLEATSAFKQQEIRFFSFVNSVWDNVVLNNQSVLKKYSDRLFVEKSSYRAGLQASYLIPDFFVFGLQNLSWIPVIAVNVWVLRSGAASFSENLTMVLLIPKQVELLEGIRTLNQMFTFWSQDQKIFQKTIATAQLHTVDLAPRIDLHRILVDQKPMASLDEIVRFVKGLKNGRILVSGSNGSGKSSLLIHIHDQFPESFYLPSVPNFYIGSDNHQSRSTGQSLADHMDFLAEIPETILLLDEWDANLDPKNKAIWNQRIDELAKHKVVLEVRQKVPGGRPKPFI